MKKIIVIIAAVGFMVAGNFSFGQDTPQPPKKEKLSPTEMADKRTEKMKEELNLTVDQTNKIGALNLTHFEEMAALKEEMRALKKQAKAKKQAHKKAVDAVLTAEQRKLQEEKMAERKAKREERKKDCKRGGGSGNQR